MFARRGTQQKKMEQSLDSDTAVYCPVYGLNGRCRENVIKFEHIWSNDMVGAGMKAQIHYYIQS